MRARRCGYSRLAGERRVSGERLRREVEVAVGAVEERLASRRGVLQHDARRRTDAVHRALERRGAILHVKTETGCDVA